MKLILILFSLFFCVQDSFSQVDKPMSADDAFHALEDGFLVVRLHVNNKRKEYYESMLKSDFKSKVLIQKKYDEYLIEREEYVQKMMYAFKVWFDICPVYFYYDFDHSKIKNGVLPNGIFLNKNGQYDATIIPPSSPYLIVARKESEGTISADSGLQILDPNCHLIPSPFPQPKTPSSFLLWFKSNNTDHKFDAYYDKFLEKMLTGWTKRLHTN